MIDCLFGLIRVCVGCAHRRRAARGRLRFATSGRRGRPGHPGWAGRFEQGDHVRGAAAAMRFDLILWRACCVRSVAAITVSAFLDGARGGLAAAAAGSGGGSGGGSSTRLAAAAARDAAAAAVLCGSLDGEVRRGGSAQRCHAHARRHTRKSFQIMCCCRAAHAQASRLLDLAQAAGDGLVRACVPIHGRVCRTDSRAFLALVPCSVQRVMACPGASRAACWGRCGALRRPPLVLPRKWTRGGRSPMTRGR